MIGLQTIQHSIAASQHNKITDESNTSLKLLLENEESEEGNETETVTSLRQSVNTTEPNRVKRNNLETSNKTVFSREWMRKAVIEWWKKTLQSFEDEMYAIRPNFFCTSLNYSQTLSLAQKRPIF
ncbi:unnamed protein product [Ceutorhynchus assimilis]|uniref:Uncharacterized protein n=1 Tax=Ceutorhynchus assimilis TaxID=467358 RepID=A0A9N9QIW4_9CUCU|nr:unnamed protein product [Ceutorhynchus assimilis]